ncbi:MAG: type I DNA topoisomerase [Acidaminococcaceae bacterium]|nr:type I DNA topoisomerase [Acidaminococcaceae bacterium]
MASLVIVESPTKAKTIKQILGKDFEVTASMGHLRDLPRSTFGIDIEKGFLPHYINIIGKADLIKKLREAARKADKIYLATDPDREGEAISWHLANLLELDPLTAQRIEVHEITPTAIREAIKHPRSIDLDKFKAQEARRIIDRIVGYELSPLLWHKIMRGLSAGRVQSVAVKIIADREKQIDDFVPQEYWSMAVELTEKGQNHKFTAKLSKIAGVKAELNNENTAKSIENELKTLNYMVKESSVKPRKRHALPPFTTSTLQQEANKQLNFNSKRTMSVAQQLFEGIAMGANTLGLITYMRTDSVRIAGEALEEIRQFIDKNYGGNYLPEKPNFYATKKNAQDAHEAIRPTSIFNTPKSVAQFLNKEQLELYTLIWNRAVASQMKDAVYEQTLMDITAGKYEFTASGSVLTFDGYRKVNNVDTEEDATENIPYIKEGTALDLVGEPKGEQHFTEPPPHYTEASLINKLESEGIGRPSTYAPTIQTIVSRNYVSRSGKKLMITELGNRVNDLLTAHFPGLIDLSFSAEMEEDLDNIAEGKMEKNKVIEHFYVPFKKSMTLAKDVIEKTPPPVEVSDVKCEVCGRMMVVKSGKFGKFLACPGYPDCKNTKPILIKIGVPCPKCGAEVLERKTKNGKTFYGCEMYPKCDFSTWDKPVNEKCFLCGNIMVERHDKGKKIIHKCSNPDCENGVKRRIISRKKKSE